MLVHFCIIYSSYLPHNKIWRLHVRAGSVRCQRKVNKDNNCFLINYLFGNYMYLHLDVTLFVHVNTWLIKHVSFTHLIMTYHIGNFDGSCYVNVILVMNWFCKVQNLLLRKTIFCQFSKERCLIGNLLLIKLVLFSWPKWIFDIWCNWCCFGDSDM